MIKYKYMKLSYFYYLSSLNITRINVFCIVISKKKEKLWTLNLFFLSLALFS